MINGPRWEKAIYKLPEHILIRLSSHDSATITNVCIKAVKEHNSSSCPQEA